MLSFVVSIFKAFPVSILIFSTAKKSEQQQKEISNSNRKQNKTCSTLEQENNHN